VPGLVWAPDDHNAGRAALAKIEALDTVVMNTVDPKTISEHVETIGSQFPSSAVQQGSLADPE
jgi:hypothetical protein